MQNFLIIFALRIYVERKLRSMKKLLFICSMIAVSLTASAQFTIYQPIERSQPSHTPSPGYGAPFTVYEPAPSVTYQSPNSTYQAPSIQQPAKPRMHEVTLH